MKSSNKECIHKLFEKQVEISPDATAVTFNEETLTYSELNKKANQLAHHLISMGAKPDMLIGICVERSFDLIIGILGILKSGAAYLPISPETPAERIRYMLEDSSSQIIITQEKFLPLVPQDKTAVLIADSEKKSAENPRQICSPYNLVYVIYTSGSTGTPKGVMIEHHSVVSRISWLQNTFPITTPDVILQKMPFSFDASVWEIFWWIIAGTKLALLEHGGEKNPASIVNSIKIEKVSVLNFVPSTLRLFIEYIESLSSEKSADLKFLRYIFVGGELLTSELVKRFNNVLGSKFGTKLINLYGPTEATIYASYYTCGSEFQNDSIPIGKPVDDTELLIVKDGNIVPEGQTGELYISGKGLARGYINNPQLTSQKFVNGIAEKNTRLYKSGDVAKMLPDGNIEFIGRVDQQVKIRGFRIELGEIENVIRSFESVKDCVVKVHNFSEDVTWIVAYIVSGEVISFTELKKYISQFLPEYMVPNSVIKIEKIPLTVNGKVDLKALPEPRQSIKTETIKSTKDGTDNVESELLKIWQDLLGIQELGIKDSFFDVGGNSILMGRLQIRINQAFKENISVVDLYQYPTINSMANYLINKIDSTNTPGSNTKIYTKSDSTDVAIIGIACKYPKADSVQEFWKNLLNGVEAITFLKDDELEYTPKDNLSSEVKFVKARGVLENVDKFDAEFFGISPREAAILDPQHRLFLELAWSALEDAGYSPDDYKKNIGVFAGSSIPSYLLFNILKNRQTLEELMNANQLGDFQFITGNDNGFLSTKVAYKLGLTGPAINVQTACSTSLVAAGQAYKSLISGECDMALAGGVSITFPQKRGYFFVDGSIGSVDGHCKPFDADATGTVFSHGAGIVLMKRLDDAISDGDSIYAVIKSVAINNDGGNRAGYMTPSVEGQSKVILRAQQIAGVHPSTIKYVETHGTGTPVGDPIEVAGLENAFRQSTNEKQFCGIGSVKSNLGHTDAAAGVTGLIKTALTLHNRVIPPTLHFTTPNPGIDFKNSPFYVVDKVTSLDGIEGPIRAAVSAFGVGGTNAHSILEEFSETSPSSEDETQNHLFVVSAKTEYSLNSNMTALADYLNNNSDKAAGDIAFTLQKGRKEFEWRQFFVANSSAAAEIEIQNIIKSGLNKGKRNPNDKPHLVFMFPGQGAQYVHMGKGLYDNEKIFREVVDQCAVIILPFLGLDIRDLLFPDIKTDETAKKLEQTVYTQPALFIIEYALAQLLLSYGIKPASMIGHSVGEYVAACLSGVFSLEDALYILSMRARLMQQQAPGSMLSVRLNEDQVKEYLTDDISMAAVNSPTLSVLSGQTVKIKELSDKLTSRNIENKVLFTSHAYHSKMMEPAIEPFVAEFKKITLQKPSAPFISSLSGTWITDKQATDPNYWAAQLRNTVRFSSGIIELQKKNNLVMLEVGPGRALSTLASQHRSDSHKLSVITTLIQPNENNDDSKNLLTAIGKLWIAGLKIDWHKFHNKKRKRLHLPTYQFDRKSYWIEAPKPETQIKQTQSAALLQHKTKKIVTKPKTKKVKQESTMTRKEYVVDILKSILEELSGMKKNDLVESISFLELGFDSLFLTQVSLSFQKKFDIKISLRQLLETTPTIVSLSEYIESKLPEGKFEPPKQEVIIEEESEEVFEELADTSDAEEFSENQFNEVSGSVERLVQQQLEIMKKQLEVLNGKHKKSVSPTAKEGLKTVEAAPTKKTEVDTKKAETTEKKVFERFGPYKPIETKSDGALTDKQQSYLANLINKYTGKTPTSKSLTQKHRSHYSDPRTVSGFLPIWKEMTYQIMIKKSEGSRLWDVDDNEYVDVLMGFGQYLFGHNPKFIRDAVEQQIKQGFEIGPQSPIAGEVAGLICELTGMDRAAFCVTGSEAVLGAIRAARTVTGKDKIVFFAGDYHGIIDEVLIKTSVNGDQIRTLPIAPGIPKENTQNSISLEYGTDEALKIIERLAPEIGAVIVEPVQARRPDFRPKEFLQKLRKLTEDLNIAFIFDEVITGFRVSSGGAQEYYGIRADIATYGKIIGGGFPIGVIAGKKLFMDAFDGGMWQYGDNSVPEAGVTFLMGTFVRHPLSLVGAYSVLNLLKAKGNTLQNELNDKTEKLSTDLNKFFEQRNVPIRIVHFSSEMYLSYPKDLKYMSLLFYALRYRGLHILEGFPIFLCTEHTDADIKFISDVIKETIIELQTNGFLPEQLDAGKKEESKTLIDHEGKTKYPVGDGQKEIWIASMMDETASCAFNESCHIQLKGNLSAEILNDSFLRLINKHEALRSTFSPDGNYQILHENSGFKLEQIDLSSHDENEAKHHLESLINKETRLKFDLVNGPLLRAKLVKLSEQNHYIILTAHHIVCDGWSYDVMVQDLSKIYSSLIESKIPDSTVPMQMKEFIQYLENIKLTDDYKQQKSYWLKMISAPLVTADLPTDTERPPLRTFTGSRISKMMEVELHKKIKHLSLSSQNTFFSSMLSIFGILLNKLTGQEDIITGIPVAGQQIVGAHDLIGHCTNLLPMRLSVQAEKSFVDYMKEVKYLVLDAYENQLVTYGDLISQLKIKRDASRIPLLSTMFNIDPAIMGLKFTGLECKMDLNPRSGYQFELGFNLVNSESECIIECDYNSDLFSTESIEKFINYYTNIIKQIVENPDIKLKDIQILSVTEMNDIISFLSN